MKPRNFYTRANRMAWNEAMPKHQAENKNKWTDRFRVPGYSAFTEPELGKLSEIGIAGRDIAHFCCNNGVELMSLKNMGAGRCVGFDISDLAIEEALGRATECNIPCEFVRTDVYDIDISFEGNFDLIYISIGCLAWMPDLKKFFAKASSLLRPDGLVFIYEQHPFADMLPCDDRGEADRLKIVESYFQSEPFEETDGIDYVGKTVYESKPNYWFLWTLSDIFMGVLSAGLSVESFFEYPRDISACHQLNEEAGIEVPLSYILTAKKDS